MSEAAPHERFEALLHTVVERHAVASRLRDTAPLAEEVLAAAQRTGDAVRRARRRGTAGPDANDCAALEAAAARLGEAIDRAAESPPVAALRDAIEAGRGAEAARLAAQLFLDLAPPRVPPAFVYRAVSLRRREGSGEALIHPEALAEELVAASRAGLRLGRQKGPLPEPLVLAPSFAACGAEVALRRAGADLHDALLEDEASGDLVSFSPVPGPFSVAVAEWAEDEWWAASPVSYTAYRARLRETLERLGVEVVVE